MNEAREQMISQQLRGFDVLDSHVLDVFRQLPRELFVPAAYQSVAYADFAIPLDDGRAMPAPCVLARLLQALDVKADCQALDVGTGSGFSAACLSVLGAKTLSIDSNAEQIERAQSLCNQLGLKNLRFAEHDLQSFEKYERKFDVVAVGGSLACIPRGLRRTLTVGGRLFVVLGQAPCMEATLFTRLSDNDWSKEVLFETDLPRLVKQEPEAFVL